MNTFQKLFGVNPKEIKKNVIITPFLNLEYFKQGKNSRVNKGFLFEVLTEKYFSVIKTGVGSSFVGDALTYLKDTPCQRLYFIGSCGAIRNLKIGDLIAVNKALAWESFSEILAQSPFLFFINAESVLYKKFLNFSNSVVPAKVATMGSLSLQERCLRSLKEQEIDAVDMEASAFLAAAKFYKFNSLALLYVTDIVGSKPFFRDLDAKERQTIKDSRQKAISLICDFITKLNPVT